MPSNSLISDNLIEDAHNRIGMIIDNHDHRLRILASKKQNFSFQNGTDKVVMHLVSGEVEIRNVKNNLVVVNVCAPAILGLSTMFVEDNFYYAHTVTQAELISIPLNDFIDIAEQQNLWIYIASIMSYYLSAYYIRDMILSQSSVYNIIKTHLEILWELNDDSLNTISIFDYILNRTPISRSSLNKVLKDLSAGGYIKLNRGKLVHMNKLPNGY